LHLMVGLGPLLRPFCLTEMLLCLGWVC
jgi:hypothetical protein